jgi:hypothetical protein
VAVAGQGESANARSQLSLERDEISARVRGHGPWAMMTSSPGQRLDLNAFIHSHSGCCSAQEMAHYTYPTNCILKVRCIQMGMIWVYHHSLIQSVAKVVLSTSWSPFPPPGRCRNHAHLTSKTPKPYIRRLMMSGDAMQQMLSWLYASCLNPCFRRVSFAVVTLIPMRASISYASHADTFSSHAAHSLSRALSSSSPAPSSHRQTAIS